MREFMDFMDLLYSREYHYVTTLKPVMQMLRSPEMQKPQYIKYIYNINANGSYIDCC